MIRHERWNWVAGLALTALLAGCSSPPPESGKTTKTASKSNDDSTSGTSQSPPIGGSGEPFVIGIAGPFTGNSSEFGAQIRMGVELYAEELNAAGGLNGRPLKLNIQDDAGKADQAQSVATTLASDDSVLAVIGHFNSSCSLAGKPLYSQAKMVLFSPASTNVDVTKNSDYVYRNIFTDDFQGQSLAQYTGEILGKKNVAILFDNDDYGAGLKDSFKKKAATLGMTIVSEAAYNKDTPDFRSQLTAIQSAQPAADAILIAGLYNEAANIARQARELGIKTQLLGGDGVFSQQYMKLAADAAEGTFVTCPFLFDLGGQKATKFAEAFRKKYSRDADAWAALSYDAVSIICDGLKKNGFTREAVLNHIKQINSPETAYDGLAGKTYFDAEGDCKKPVQVAEVKGGKFVAAQKQLPSGPSAPTPSASAVQTTTP